MAVSTRNRVQKRRETLRASGLRPIQIWVPDARRPGFAEECRRQALAAMKADRVDPNLGAFLDAALDDLDAGKE